MSIKARDLNKGAIQRIGADLVHQYNKGTGVRVGIVSDGTFRHPTYQKQIKGGWDFVNDTPLADTSGDSPDGHYFGTFSAGLIAGSGLPFKASLSGGPLDIGILGVAPEAHLYDLRVVGEDRLVNEQVAVKAVDWAIANRLEVLYFVFGSQNPSAGFIKNFSDAIDRAYAAGIVLVAPVGSNYANHTDVNLDWPPTTPLANFPASHSNVFGTAEIDHQTDRPDFYKIIWDTFVQITRTWRFYHARDGNTGLVAPGGDNTGMSAGVGSTYGTGSTIIDRGSFVASALVTGVIALVISGGWAATPAGVAQRLKDTATRLSSSGLSAEVNQKIYGSGLVNALLAAPPRTVTGTVEGQKAQLKIGPAGLGEPATVTLLAGIPPRVVLKADPLPYLERYPSPMDGETNVPLWNPIRFRLKSDTAGIDITTVRVKIGGEVYKYGDKEFTFRGSRNAYDIEVRRGQPWAYEEVVTVEIEAEDLAGKPGLIYERILGD